MRDPAGLYELHPSRSPRCRTGLHLVAGLTGFADAGGAVTQFSEYLLDTLEHEVVADVRRRRPARLPGAPSDHLLRSGPPDRLPARDAASSTWRTDELRPAVPAAHRLRARLPVGAVHRGRARARSTRFQVTTTTWVHAIPMPVPHTRPIGVTVSGNRTELIEAMSVWQPAHAGAGERAAPASSTACRSSAHPIVGFVLLIPHYLADTEYPAAAVTALESVSAATGLIFPTDRLREEDRDFVAKIDEQVAENAELGQARRHARGAARQLHGGQPAALAADGRRRRAAERPTRSPPSSRTSSPSAATATTTRGPAGS